MMLPADFKSALRQQAVELGFDACRFTTAVAPESTRHFQQWLAAGCHGEMAWLARGEAKRANPQLVLAKAKTIICLAAAYPEIQAANQPDSRNASPIGIIARYARFRDYHVVLAEKLKLLVQFLHESDRPNRAPSPLPSPPMGEREIIRSLWYVDTGPILERDLAQRAGLGFIGKHTNLISRPLGNWFFLAEILTTLELPPDAPERNHCGTCTRCLTACPTNAITAPFQLDARRCISYLTIELKGAIPIELRPLIGHRIFGCDDCLAVCPWNRFAAEGKLMQAHARPDLAAPDLIEMLALDEAGFKQRFRGTPIERTRRRGLLRNVCVALGNAGDPRTLPALEKAAHDPEPLIAEHARWAIEQLERTAGKPG